VPKPCAFDVEMAIEKLQKNKLPGSDHTPAEMINVIGKTIRSVFHKLTNSMLSEEELPESGRSRSLYMFTKGVLYLFRGSAIKETAVITSNYRGI